MESYKKTKLDSGLRLITIPVENANSVTVLILVGTGSKYETKDINGMSHFLEHMFFKGTEKRPDTLTISETLDRIGGQYNAFTSKEVTGFWAKVDKKHTDVALDWISDMFLNSKFDKDELEREKGVVIEELNMYLDTPTSHVSELFEDLLYGDQPAGWRIVGEKQTILDYTREKLLNYYHSHYSNENTVVCVAGDVNSKEIEEKVRNYFSKIEIRESPEKLKTLESQKSPGILLHYKKTDQTHFCLGVRAYDMYDPRRYALKIISVVLGGNMSSRLFISVRERNGLAYYVNTSYDGTTDAGYLVTQAGIKNDSLEKAVSLVLKEYKDLSENGITEKELQKAKDYLRGATSLSLDSTDSKASFYAMQEVMGEKVLTPEEKIEMIDKVSLSDIKNVAEDIFKNEKLNLSVIGPFDEKDKESLEKILKI
ncbi:MAG: insulinase family protein [Candidatus Staskawiczbacteria bacterium]|nr:insulinase family protein [Candidatus Staskawiczbacteria bacterium]